MFSKTLFVRWVAWVATVVLLGCSSEPGGSDSEDVGDVSQATTGGSCVSAALAGECRYTATLAYASSVESSSLGPDRAIDGDCNTRWSSQFSDPQWLKVDLGTNRPLSRVLIHWEAAASSSYELQVSDDASSWTKVATHANATITGTGSSRVDTIAGLTSRGRYVRVYSKARTTAFGNSVRELEVFGTGCATQPTCSQIPVYPVGAAASSSQHSEKTPDKAIDGSMVTRWSSAFTDAQWLRLDLGKSQAISRVVLDWEASASGKYDLQVSEATSGPWTTIHSRTDNRIGPRTDDISNLVGNGRYLRINSSKRTTQYGISLFEVKVYRQSCDACDQLLTPAPAGTTASSQESAAYAPAKATDGDRGTRWSSAFSDPQWLRLDFGHERRIKQVVIGWEGAASKSYRLEGSASLNGPWQTIAQRTNQPAGPRLDTLENLNATARYLRVYSTARTGTYGNSIVEINVLGAANPLACSGSCAFGDTDLDTVADCFDACPRDPTKTSPGICDCGVPDDDLDGDGVPNCKDGCNSPADQSVGECGCPNAPAPAGTPCSDGPCPGNNVCNGAGQCGGAAQCPVAPGCVTKQVEDNWYWFCPGNFTWQDARTRCAQVEGKLVTADTPAENALIASNMVGSSAWIGGNDVSVDGQWRWANITSDGERFWNGTANGSSYFTAFSAWASGAPASGHACAALSTGGRWVSDSCTATRGFICEASVEDDDEDDDDLPGPTSTITNPPAVPCVPAATYFKDANGNVLAEEDVGPALQKCKAAQSACEQNPFGTACTDACNGITAIPTGNACPGFDDAEKGELCLLKELAPAVIACSHDAMCEQAFPGAGMVCGRYLGNCPVETRRGVPVSLSTLCKPVNADGSQLSGLVCGKPADGCARVNDVDFTSLCDGAEICTEPELIQGEPQGFNGSQTFKREDFKPTTYFTEPTQPNPAQPFPAEDKPCPASGCNFGTDHPWCHLSVENQLPAPQAVTPDKSGSSGGDLASFDVDPQLSLEYSANIGPFGFPVPAEGQERGLKIVASAGFTAKVHYDVFGGGSLDVVDILARAVAHECGIETDVHFKIFDLDFLPLVATAPPEFLPDEAFQERCTAAFRALQEAGDRAKKALRDASHLLAQYHKKQNTPVTTDNFSPGTCAELIENAPRGFPAVNCQTDGVEGAINGFIEYYRRSVAGFAGLNGAGAQLKGVGEVVKDFVAAAVDYAPTAAIPLFEIPGRNEEITIVELQFFIGPVPVNLEIMSLINYSGIVSLEAVMKPGAIVEQLLLTKAGQSRSRLFFIQANGAPQAGLGLAAFAGVGFGVPGFSAKIGIQGEVQLANIALPVHAGAGIGLGTEPETERPLAADLAAPISTGEMLIQPKRFTLSYEYGAGLSIKLRNILGGSIKAKLKLKIAFFSKTWSKTLVQFKGICPGAYTDDNGVLNNAPCNIPLISIDGSGQMASAGFPWGVVRPKTPFVELKTLTPKAQTPGNTSVAVGDAQEFFYDGQCTCIEPAEPAQTERECFRDPDCCEGSICFPEPVSQKNICTGCRTNTQTCYDKFDCCGGSFCLPTPNAPLTCKDCQPLGLGCTENEECCGFNGFGTGNSCVAGTCKPISPCDQPCDDEKDCGIDQDGFFLVCTASGKCDTGSANPKDGCRVPK